MTLAKPEAVLFDMGGVLLDPADRWDAETFARSFPEGLAHRALEPWFIALSRDLMEAFLAFPVPRPAVDARPFIETWLWKRQVLPTEAQVAYWHDQLCRWEARPVYPFVRESLKQLRAMGLRLGVISNTVMPAVHIRQRFAEAGILELFEFMVFSAEFGLSKPHPALFRHALATMGLAPEAAWYVGDKPQRDVCGAHGAGMTAVLVESRHAHRTADGPECAPDVRVRDVRGLLGVIGGI